METTTTELFIGGNWSPAMAGGTIDIIDPATEELVTRAAQADRDDVNAAIDAAQAAFLKWRKVSPWERSKVLRKTAQLVEERSETIARRLTLETGKPLAQARGEVVATIEMLDWYADEARRIFGQTLPGRSANNRFMTVYEPVGVVAAFTAWNFPWCSWAARSLRHWRPAAPSSPGPPRKAPVLSSSWSSASSMPARPAGTDEPGHR